MTKDEVPPPATAEGIWIDRNVGIGWLILDLRTAEEFAGGHIPGSLNVPLAELESYGLRIKLFGEGRRLAYVAPGPGRWSVRRRLARAGLGHARRLEGGISRWVASGFQLERAPDAGLAWRPRWGAPLTLVALPLFGVGVTGSLWTLVALAAGALATLAALYHLQRARMRFGLA